MYWKVGDYIDRFTFLSFIDENYTIPECATDVYFCEGRLIMGDDGPIDGYIIKLPLRGETLKHLKGQEFRQIGS